MKSSESSILKFGINVIFKWRSIASRSCLLKKKKKAVTARAIKLAFLRNKIYLQHLAFYSHFRANISSRSARNVCLTFSDVYVVSRNFAFAVKVKVKHIRNFRMPWDKKERL